MPANEIVNLWPSGSANNPPGEGAPRLEIYLPEGTPTGPRGAVLVLPGGGYNHLAAHEGEPVARFFADRGLVGAVCYYRVAPHYYPAPVADATRAVRLLREHAPRYGIDAQRLAAIGFSAGAHLAATIVTQPDLHCDPDDDLVGRQSARTDRLILAYGALSMQPEGNPSLAVRLFGPDATDAQRDLVSAERHVTRDTPPTFLFHTADDPTVPVWNAIAFFRTLRAQSIPAELHIYETGRHGVGLAADNPRLRSWPGLACDWLVNGL